MELMISNRLWEKSKHGLVTVVAGQRYQYAMRNEKNEEKRVRFLFEVQNGALWVSYLAENAEDAAL